MFYILTAVGVSEVFNVYGKKRKSLEIIEVITAYNKHDVTTCIRASNAEVINDVVIM